MITKEDLVKLNGAGTLLHASLIDSKGAPLKARLNGKLQEHKGTALKFKQPMKYGLYSYFYVTQMNLNEWNLDA